jgi:LysM repeat protein
MARRSPARLLAPLALVGFVVALLIVINGAGQSDGTAEKTGARPKASATATPTRRQKARKARKRYVVKAGDTPSGIAEKTGVPLSQILELNPDLDDQSLTVGDKIKLRP